MFSTVGDAGAGAFFFLKPNRRDRPPPPLAKVLSCASRPLEEGRRAALAACVCTCVRACMCVCMCVRVRACVCVLLNVQLCGVDDLDAAG